MNIVSFVIASIAEEFAESMPRDIYEVLVVHADNGITYVKYWRI